MKLKHWILVVLLDVLLCYIAFSLKIINYNAFIFYIGSISVGLSYFIVKDNVKK